MEEIKVVTSCNACDSHQTELGTLKMLEESVKKNFPDWSIDKQCELVLNWFEKGWQTELANLEKNWKEDMAKTIQKNKQSNIRKINQ